MTAKAFLAGLLLSITLVLVLAACNNYSSTDKPTNSTDSTATLTATVSTEISTAAQATEIVVTEQPVAPEKNLPGDIPDTQAFILYIPEPGTYELEIPEGWARSENGPNVTFVDKLDGVMVTLTDTAAAPTTDSVRSKEVAALEKSSRAVQVTGVKAVNLPSGSAVLVEYTSNSEPNDVTGKQVRLENSAYYFYKNGKLATLTLWAPLGADNVDQWQRMSQSFKWR